MIFVTFVLCVAIFLFFAAGAGNINTFINLDSILIVLVGFVLSSLAVAVGRYKAYFSGLRQIFSFKPVAQKSSEVKSMVTAVSIMTLAVGVCSTAQGLISASLIENGRYNFLQVLSLSSFTTVYAIIFVALLLVPIIFLNKQ